MPTPQQDYFLERIKNFTIDDTIFLSLSINSQNPEDMQRLNDILIGKRKWVKVTLTDINFSSLLYADDTGSVYRYIFSIYIYGGLMNIDCCTTNPVTEIECGSAPLIDTCLFLHRINKNTGIADNQVPFDVIDMGVSLLGGSEPDIAVVPKQSNKIAAGIIVVVALGGLYFLLKRK